MSLFYVNSESSEDTFNSAANLQDAVRIAREVAAGSPAGETVSIEHLGKNVLLFVKSPSGEVVEQPIAKVSELKLLFPAYETTISSNSTAGSPSQ